MYFMFVHYHVWEWLSMLLVFLIQFIWQAKNAMVPYVNFKDVNNASLGWDRRYFGGMGYSYKAEIWGAGGVIFAILVDLMWPPHIREPPGEDGMEESSFEE